MILSQTFRTRAEKNNLKKKKKKRPSPYPNSINQSKFQLNSTLYQQFPILNLPKIPKFPEIATAMSTPTNQSTDDIVDTTPFLSSSTSHEDSNHSQSRRSIRRQGLREAARFLRRASSRHTMREPSMVVRETAAEQLEERQSDWAYSKPVVVLDIIWNLAFVAVAFSVMVLSRNERPNMPLRLWIIGYAIQCVLHMVCVCVEYKRRRRRRVSAFSGTEEGNLNSGTTRGDSGEYVSLANQLEEEGTRYFNFSNRMGTLLIEFMEFCWLSVN